MSEPGPGLAAPTLWLLAAAFALAGPMLALAPLGMTPLLLAVSVAATGVERRRNGTWPWPGVAATWLFLALCAWCGLSLLWDLDAGDGARKLLDLVLILAALSALLGLARRMSGGQQRVLARCLIASMVAGLVLLAIETAFDFPLYRALLGNGDPRLVDLIEAKRSVDALPLLVWPAALALACLGKPRLALLLTVAFAVMCFKLTASSATLGMAVSLLVFAAATWSRRPTWQWLRIGTALAFLLVIPFSISAYHNRSKVALFKRSAQHRVEIWHFAAQKALERPLFGHGFNASRHVPNGDAVSAFQAPGKPIIPLHPHDAFLQIWLELGLVGVVIVGALMAAGLAEIGRWPARPARFGLAGYAAGVVVAGLAFGIWQTWWMATLAFSVATCRIVMTEQTHG